MTDALQAAAQDIYNAQNAAGAGAQAGPQPGPDQQPNQSNGGAEDVEFEEVK